MCCLRWRTVLSEFSFDSSSFFFLTDVESYRLTERKIITKLSLTQNKRIADSTKSPEFENELRSYR